MRKRILSLLGAIVIGGGVAIAQPHAASTATAELAPTDRQDFEQAVLALDDPHTPYAELARADAVFQRTMRRYPRFAPAYREEARFILRNMSFIHDPKSPGNQAAEALIEHALELDPGYADAYILRSHLDTRTNRFDAAEEALKKAQALGSRSPWLYVDWGDVMYYRDRFAVAETKYRQALASPELTAPARDRAQQGLIESLVRLARFKDADALYQEYVRNNPTQASAYADYARFQSCKLNDQPAALRTVRRALDLRNPAHARRVLIDVLFARWAQLMLSGHAAEARPLLQEAHDMGSDQPSTMVAFPESCPVMFDVIAALDKFQPTVEYFHRGGVEPDYYWGNAYPKLVSGPRPPHVTSLAPAKPSTGSSPAPAPAPAPDPEVAKAAAQLLDWKAVERDDNSLTLLLKYRYNGALGKAYIGAQAMINGEVSAQFGDYPDNLNVGTGTAQVTVSLNRDSPVRVCTDALKVSFYVNNSFRDDILPYRHCWQKAPTRNAPPEPLPLPGTTPQAAKIPLSQATPPRSPFGEDFVGCYARSKGGPDFVKVDKPGGIYNVSFVRNGWSGWWPAGSLAEATPEILAQWVRPPVAARVDHAVVNLGSHIAFYRMKPGTRLPGMFADSDYLATDQSVTKGVYRHPCA